MKFISKLKHKARAKWYGFYIYVVLMSGGANRG